MIVFYFLVGIMPLSEHHIWGKFVGDLTVFKYIGGASAAYALVHLITSRTLPPYLCTWQARLFLIFYAMASVSYFSKTLPGIVQLNPFLSYSSFLFLFFITVTVVDSATRLRWVMLVSIGSVAFASLYMIREWQQNHKLFADFRPGWVVGDPNYFTISALLTMPAAYYLMVGSRRIWERGFCAVCLSLTLLAVTFGASRGGFLGLVTAFLFLVWQSRERVRNLVLVGLFVLPISFLFPVSPLNRLLYPSQVDLGAEDSRTAVWWGGLKIIETHPVLGIGLGNFKPLVPEYEHDARIVDTVAHNSYIEIGAEQGLPALFVFLGILVSSLLTLGRLRVFAFRAGLPFFERTALSLQAGLLGSFVAIFFVSGQYQKLLWLTIFLTMCMPGIVRSTLDFHERSEKSIVVNS